MEIKAEGFIFDFPDAIDCIKFDDKDTHGAFHAFKAVDLIVEFPDEYLFIEIKDPPNGADDYKSARCKHCGHKSSPLNELKNSLVRKYRDSWVYRYCQDKTGKPMTYVCLVTIDSALIMHMVPTMKSELPLGIAVDKWHKTILDRFYMVNLAAWERKLHTYGSCRRE